jgi:hypothetical protein
VVGKLYNNSNPHKGDLKEMMRVPYAKDYHNTQKHISEKFQKLMSVDKIRNEDAASKLNGVIGGSDIKKRNLYNNGHPRKRYMEE